jgi:hypothetical protein
VERLRDRQVHVVCRAGGMAVRRGLRVDHLPGGGDPDPAAVRRGGWLLPGPGRRRVGGAAGGDPAVRGLSPRMRH